MPLCATYNITGAVLIVTPPPADLSTCALLISTAAEWGNNPFALSEADGIAIASAIVLVWTVGFCWRALNRTLSLGDSNHEQDS